MDIHVNKPVSFFSSEKFPRLVMLSAYCKQKHCHQNGGKCDVPTVHPSLLHRDHRRVTVSEDGLVQCVLETKKHYRNLRDLLEEHMMAVLGNEGGGVSDEIGKLINRMAKTVELSKKDADARVSAATTGEICQIWSDIEDLRAGDEANIIYQLAWIGMAESFLRSRRNITHPR